MSRAPPPDKSDDAGRGASASPSAPEPNCPAKTDALATSATAFATAR